MVFTPLQTERLKWGEFLDLEMYGMLASDAEHAPTAT
jgi:hypothetical protein